MRAAYIAAAAVAAAALWYAMEAPQDDNEQTDDVPADDDLLESAAQAVDEFTGGVMKISSMGRVTANDVANTNVQAFLRVIRRGEGTSDQAGYSRLFGGKQFEGFAGHPRIKVTAGGYTSTAAGAYQILAGTWDETRRVMGLTSFDPPSQDFAAVGLIAKRGALDDIKAGRFEMAVRKCAPEWASLPYSPYGQPVISMGVAYSTYAANGGSLEPA